MPKLTPEIFSQLDPEDQLRLLEDVPVDQLNSINCYEVGSDMSTEEGAKLLAKLYTAIPEDKRVDVMTVLLNQLFHLTSESAERDGIKPPPQMMGMIMLLTNAVNILEKKYRELEDDDEQTTDD